MSLQSNVYSSELLRNSKRIGLFDSGVGGLSVLKQLQSFAAANAQDVDFVYLGDTARCPYGNRTAEEIAAFVREIVTWLNGENVDVVVMACNTSAAMAFDDALSISRVPVLDLITSTAHYVAKHATKVGVMATVATARSRAFSKAINKVNPRMEVKEFGCPELVPIVEGDKFNEPETAVILNRYIEQLRAENVDTLILGCTHFPFLKEQIARLASDMVLIDPAEILTFNSRDIIERIVSEKAKVDPELKLGVNSTFNTSFYVTGQPELFQQSASRCLGQSVTRVSHLSTEILAVMLAAEEAHKSESIDISVMHSVINANTSFSNSANVQSNVQNGLTSK